jgi:formamidopyrimidine-DNA glycosylase
VPELPEVETVRSALERAVVGRTVAAVAGQRVQMRRALDPARLDGAMRGRRLVGPRRRGKFLLVDFDPPGTLLVHLGMSGRLLLVPGDDPMLPHTHLVVALDDGRQIRLVDPRRFGLACWLEPGEESNDPSLLSLGMEPLDDHLIDVLPPLLRKRRSPLKALLLDQSLVLSLIHI